MVVLDSRSAQQFTATMRQFQTDVHREWHETDYDCWEVDRAAGWADSTAVEVRAKVAGGTGKLYPNGQGGPIASELVISIESPFRFRTTADAPIVSGHLLVLDGQRLFRVDSVKPLNTGDVLMDVYLTEMFNMEVPV